MNEPLAGRRAPIAPVLALAALQLSGCGGEPEPAPSPGAGANAVRAPEPAAAAAFAPPASEPERLAEIAEHLDRGQLEPAVALLEQLGGAGGVPAMLLRARAALLSGDPVAAMRGIEAARAAAPRDASVFATAAEIYAALGRGSAAEDEIRAGLELAGETPELLRARAVLALTKSGGAEKALELLDRARAFDPRLPLTGHVRAQAHLLVGRARLQSNAPGEALEHALAGLALRPGELDLREVEADARASLGDLEAAIAIRAELERAGRACGPELAVLHRRAATAALLRGDRPAAIEHYLAARARGAGIADAELGFGAELLAAEARTATARGVALYEAGDVGASAAEFERALELDPSSLEARNHLAVARFREGDFARAAAGFERVLALARERGIELPEPVHLNLARALRQGGQVEQARGVLAEYLEREPEGDWVHETREMLRALGDG